MLFLQIFMLPFILVGLWMILILLHRMIIPIAGVTAPATIISRETSSGEDGQSYKTNFTYTYGGVSYSGSCNVERNVYDQLETGAPAQVEILSFAPSIWPRLSNPPGNYQFGNIAFLIFFTLFWNGVVGIFVWGIYIWPVVARRVYQWGAPATATIVDKKTTADEDSTSYIIKYEFTPIDIHGRLGNVVKGQQTVSETSWKELRTGDQCTVLYSPDRPRTNVLYQYGEYRVVG